MGGGAAAVAKMSTSYSSPTNVRYYSDYASAHGEVALLHLARCDLRTLPSF